jgi:hypothetical protein
MSREVTIVQTKVVHSMKYLQQLSEGTFCCIKTVTVTGRKSMIKAT